MTLNLFNPLKEKYDETFKKELERNINDEKIKLYNKDIYYLINDSNLNNPAIQYYKNITFSKGYIKFIDNFSSLINCLKNKSNYRLITRNLLELLLSQDELNKHKQVLYYSGNKKIIIEFKDNSEPKALLVFNPLKVEKEICIIKKYYNEKENKKLYDYILSKKIKHSNSLLNDSKLSDVINTLEDFLQNNVIITKSNTIKRKSNRSQNNYIFNNYFNIKKNSIYIGNNNYNLNNTLNQYKKPYLFTEESLKKIYRTINNEESNEKNEKNNNNNKFFKQIKTRKHNEVKKIKGKDNNIETINELKKQIEVFKSENENLKNKYNQIEIELNNLKNENESLKTNIINQENKYKETINEKEQEITRIKKDYSKKEIEFEKKIETLEQSNETKEKKLNNMNKQLEQCKKEINDLKQKKINYESLLNNKDEDIKRLKNETTELCNDINILKKKEKDYVINEKKFKENEADYKNKINILEKEKEELKNKIDKIQNELNKQTQQNEQLIEENKILNEINKYKKNEENYNKLDDSSNKQEEIINKGEQELLIKEKELNKNMSLLEKEEEKNMKEKETESFNKDKDKNKQIIEENAEISKENNKKKIEEYCKLISNKEECIKKQKKEQLMKMNPKIIIKPKKKMPLMKYKYPTLIGLNNIGGINFMNAILQCLSQTKSLTNYFLNPNNKNKIIHNNIAVQNKDALQLSPVYLELIQKLWDNNMKESFSPYNFKNTIEAMNISFKLGQDGDYKDFIVFLLEQFHKELKKTNNNDDNICLDRKNESFNQYDKNQILNHFLEDFKNECSIIYDTFFGYNEITNECLNCKNIYDSKNLENSKSYKYEVFNCLTFPLEEVQKMKNNSNHNNIQINQKNIVSLYDCFYYISKSIQNKGEKKNICHVCKKMGDSIITTNIYSSPSVLILILKWGKNNDVNLNYEEIIDITKFVQLKGHSNIIYNLYGVIAQIEGSNTNFVASCKSPIDNKWYRYNDAIVKLITNVQKDVIEFGIPYILFYVKC